ncbi:MAG: T9SS type A sorting domain-containing protein [Marinoscillum sp.]
MNPLYKLISRKLLVTVMTILSIFQLSAQGTFMEEGLSIRNGQQDHYYKMVTWEDSAYQELAYWKESEFGTVMEFMNWRAIFPQGYDSTGTTDYPMIVMLHGAGESGRKWTGHYTYETTDPEYDNNGHNLKWGGIEHRNAINNGKFPGIVIFPQSSYNAAWDTDDLRMVTLIIEHMIEAYHASPYRISVHGLSNGAVGSWNYANYRPDLVASILPMSGIGSDKEPTTDKLVTTPVWLFQGGQDSNPSPGAAENWKETLEGKGGKPRYTFYPDNDHNTWLDAYREPDFFSWMLARDKRNIYVFGDTTGLNIAPNETVDLGFSAGYAAYQWTLDSVAISGATSRYYTAEEPGTYRVQFKRYDSTAWVESFPLELEPYTGPPIVYIPDSNFKNNLLQDTTINTNQDGQIQVTEAEAYAGQLKLNSENISDLTGIEAFINITDLRVHYNNLSELDLSANTKIKELHCQSNQLESLDLSQNTALKKLRCFDNQLTTLNVQNGNNHNFGLFQAENNNLGCIQVDDVTYAMNNWTDDVDSTAEFSLECGDQIVEIPDSNFKNALLANSNININSDDEIQLSEAESVTDTINIAGMGIDSLNGIEAFINLKYLVISNNNIGALDLSGNDSLKSLQASSNQLSMIAFSNDSKLQTLNLDSNSLSTIDVSGLLSLKELSIQNNQLDSLNLSANTALEMINCSSNNLEYFSLKNGQNDQITAFNALNNQLTCIEVSDVTYANSNWSEEVDSGVGFAVSCYEEVVDIPDSTFKNALLADTSININSDGEIQLSEAESVTDTINVAGMGIDSLNGIEAFINLKYLVISNNNIGALDLSGNDSLKSLQASSNQLSMITFSNDSKLQTLNLDSNSLSTIDVSGLLSLKEFSLQSNQLDSLNLSANTALEMINCSSNNLEYFNLKNGQNDQITAFNALNNQLSCIEVSDVTFANSNWSEEVDSGVSFSESCSTTAVYFPDQNFKDELLAIAGLNTNSDGEIQFTEAESYTGAINVNSSNITDITGIEAFTALKNLRVHNNSITSIDVSANTELVELHCQKNNLTSLDISANTKIKKLRCFDNDLTSLNVQNGNNDNFDFIHAYDNNLTCIQVDDVSYAENNWSDDVDSGVSFSTDCSGGSSSSMASSVTAFLENSSPVYPNPFRNEFRLKQEKEVSIDDFKVLDFRSGQVVKPHAISQFNDEIIVDLSNMNAGVYLIKYGDSTYRILKNE